MTFLRMVYLAKVAVLVPVVALAACDGDQSIVERAGAEVFNIAPETVECYGPFLRMCIVVNGSLFYDGIEGYQHVEGQAETICVKREKRKEPIPQDVGAYTFHRVPC